MPRHRLYDDNLYRFDTPQHSYWEATAGPKYDGAAALDTDESCDVAIIGGGYTGLSAALHLARDHDIDVRVLEAGHVGWGASGRKFPAARFRTALLRLGMAIARWRDERR